MSILDIGFKVDSHKALIIVRSMAIILSGQRILMNIKKSDIMSQKTLWILNALTVGSNSFRHSSY